MRVSKSVFLCSIKRANRRFPARALAVTSPFELPKIRLVLAVVIGFEFRP